MEPKQEHPDWQLVVSLGGPTKVAERLGWTSAGSVQRVQNWKSRGIPAAVKLAHPKLFRREARAAKVVQLAQQLAARDAAADRDYSQSIDNSSKG